MKYIVLEVSLANIPQLEIPIVFPDILVHAIVAEHQLAACLKHYPGATAKAIAAGDVKFEWDGPRCFGKSESLQLTSREDVDSNLIRRCDYSHCVIT